MMFVYICVAVFALVVIFFLVRSYEKFTNAVCKSTKRLDGKTCLVTGGTAGMGLEIAREFAARGARVIVACPFPEEGAAAEATIIQQTGNAKVTFKHLDLGSFASVRKFAEDIEKTEDRLDILVNNAGVALLDGKLTADGINRTMQVNYFGHFLLTLLLLPMLKKTGEPLEPTRIINTGSILHYLVWNVDVPSLEQTHFSVLNYSISKLCCIYFSRELAKKLCGCNVVVNSVNPGYVGTNNLWMTLGTLGYILSTIGYYCYKTPWEGAQTALHAALDRSAGEKNGKYFTNCAVSFTSPLARQDDIAKQVWDKSVSVVKLSQEELKQCLA